MTATKLANEVRLPVVAGAFYPASPVQLTQMIDGYLAEAQRLEPEPSILIVPHAGYHVQRRRGRARLQAGARSRL